MSSFISQTALCKKYWCIYEDIRRIGLNYSCLYELQLGWIDKEMQKAIISISPYVTFVMWLALKQLSLSSTISPAVNRRPYATEVGVQSQDSSCVIFDV